MIHCACGEWCVLTVFYELSFGVEDAITLGSKRKTLAKLS